MNRAHPTIQFEMSYSVNEISFLNILILNRDNELHRTLYKKTTDLPSLPHSYSFYSPPPPLLAKQASYTVKLCNTVALSPMMTIWMSIYNNYLSYLSNGAIILALLLNYFPRCTRYREMISYNPIHRPLVTNYHSLFHLIWILHGSDRYYMSIGKSLKKTTTCTT